MKFNPDLVILTEGRANELADTLDSVGVKTCVLRQPKTIQEIPDYIKIVGEVADTKAAADSLAEKVAAYLKASAGGQKIESVLLIHPNGGIGQKGSMLLAYVKHVILKIWLQSTIFHSPPILARNRLLL